MNLVMTPNIYLELTKFVILILFRMCPTNTPQHNRDVILKSLM